MDHRADTERMLRDAYAARARGDVPAILNAFCQHGRFHVASSDARAMSATGHPQIEVAMTQLCQAFELLEHEIVTLVIDADGAAVQWRGKFRFAPTGETVTTELVHIIRLEDGRIASLTEFCDTALVARVLGTTNDAGG
jgi:ketosteroid isomerase-like protein